VDARRSISLQLLPETIGARWMRGFIPYLHSIILQSMLAAVRDVHKDDNGTYEIYEALALPCLVDRFWRVHLPPYFSKTRGQRAWLSCQETYTNCRST